MSGGGKGGKQTTEVKIPAWLEAGARENMARANELAKIGYVPYFGPDVAAFSPMQQAAFQNTNDAASAFGMAAPSDPMAGMPAPQTFAGGVQGYSSAPMYQEALSQLQATNPGQYAALMAPFINPQTGAQPGAPFGSGGSFTQPTSGQKLISAMLGGSSGGGGGGGYTPTSGGSGGYTSLRDMFDGGGPGTPGSTYSGGPLSGTLNTIGVRPAGSGGSSSGMGGGK
jgi:hypothetical protein